jgi:Uma2 family endonuclease
MPSIMRSAGTDARLPAVDDRLVAPETPYEIVDGRLVRVSPADPPHAERHLQLCALIEAHVGAGFVAACDLLTRTSRIDDIAPDVSVYPAAPDRETGGRQIEQLAFEVVSTQTLGRAGRKAAKLARRGVRRVFAIDVEGARALEWHRGRWRRLDPTGEISDAALAVALPVAALIQSVKTDDVVARALAAKRNRVIEELRAKENAEGLRRGKAEGKAEGLRRGKAEGIRRGKVEGMRRGKAEAVIAVLAAREVSLKRTERDRILHERDLARVERWLARAVTCKSAAALLAGSKRRGASR